MMFTVVFVRRRAGKRKFDAERAAVAGSAEGFDVAMVGGANGFDD